MSGGSSSSGFSLQPKSLSFLDRMGIRMETGMTDFFTWWGTICASYPLPVMVVSVAIALGLTSGVM